MCGAAQIENVGELGWQFQGWPKGRYMTLHDDADFATVAIKFPTIANKIKVFWGNPEFSHLMFELQQDSSDRPRAGFPLNVLAALQSLEQLHDVEFPQFKRVIPSFWQTLRRKTRHRVRA
jgi:hypothetical protein